MATPFSTPRYPGAPNPTPRSTGKVPRAPIHNPYDKFTQPEFDAWIGDITGALKRALGRDDAPPIPTSSARAQRHSPDEEDSIEDSFAEVRARRLAKGKERAREEDYEEEDVHHQHGEGTWYGASEEEEEDEYGSSSEEDEEEAPKQREVEVIDLLSDDEEDEQEQETGSSDEESVAGLYDDEEAKGGEVESDEEVLRRVPLDEDEDEAEGSDVSSEEARSSPAPGPSSAHEVTEILDSDEEEVAQQVPAHRALPPRFARKSDVDASARVVYYDDDKHEEDQEDEDEQAEEEAQPFPPRTVEVKVDIQDPWSGPRMFAEDLYTGGDMPASVLQRGNPHVLPTEEDIDVLAEDDLVQPLDIPDPWEGPRTYAEDFYSGGDVLTESLENVTPSHLTPREDKIYIPGVTSPVGETSQSVAEKPDIFDDHAGDDLNAEVEAPSTVQNSTHHDQNTHSGVSDLRSSPSPTHLTRHVDWNWPPAFPGKVATGPGHLSGQPQDIIAISDDEDDEAFPTGVSTETPAVAMQDDSNDQDTGFADYTDFGLYEMGQQESSLDMQGTFEPVSVNELDFGDLPPSRGERFQDVASVSAVVDKDQQAAFDKKAVEASDILEYPDDDVQDEEKPMEVHEDPLEMAVVVEEVEDEDDDVRVATTTTAEIDVVSVSGDGVNVVSAEYSVEEIATEGRRTVEPEVTPALEEVPQAVAAISEDLEPEAEANEVPSVHIDTELVAASSTEYPAPVSADPTVPDPASIAPTPASPASPVDSIASSIGEKEVETSSIPAHAALFPLLRKNAVAHSPSGLFTPLTTGSITPEFPPEEAEADVDANADMGGEGEIAETPQGAEPDRVDEVELPAVGVPEPVVDTEFPDKAEHGAPEAAPVEPPAIVVATNETDVVEAVPQDPSELPLQVDVVDMQASERHHEDSTPSEKQPDAIREVAATHGENRPSQVLADEVLPVEAEANTDEGQTTYLETEEADPGREETSSTDGDADAEGELDPDYVPSEDEGVESSPVVTDEPTLPTQPIEDDDPFFIKQVDESVPQENGFVHMAQDDDHDSIASSSADKELPITATNGTSELPAMAEPEAGAAEPAASQETEVIASQETELAASQETVAIASQETAVDEGGDEVRPLKRKRTSPPAEKPTRLLRSRTVKSLDKGKASAASIAKSKKGKGKGKQREREESGDEDDVASVASETTSGGSSVAAQQLLIPGSRASSRASSVVSNAPSTYSGLSQPSPTMLRTMFGNADQPILPPRHDGGILRHHHGGRLLAPAVPAAPAIPAPPPPAPQFEASKPPSNASEKSSRASAEPAPSQSAKPLQPVQALASRPSIAASTSSNSPVTRANCRYHTISIPRSGHARRSYFAVPGCSLGNAELMKEEHIQDHGNVDSKDLDKLIPYVEHLDLSSYLLGVLRQLVGVDLLRENEVYYLPMPGDHVKLKRRPRAHSTQGETITRAQRESISARTLSSSAAGRTKDVLQEHAPRAMPPPSQASVSTSGGSASRAGKLSERGSVATSGSFSGSDLSELEDDEEDLRPQKRVKGEHFEPQPVPDAGPKTEEPEAGPSHAPATNGIGTASASTTSRRLQPRRSRKLGADALAYKPEGGESDGSDEEGGAPKKRKRGRGGRGIKRKGTEENGDTAPANGGLERPKRRRKATQEASEVAQ